ncbi:Metal-tetracycline/H(+) antiporter [Listeria grayi]|uniref:Metal-tetracycline/H(+) antiporter n=1 Tax=Listeria grayi TaxID=1641 RepID=A0A378MI35_LISGR|nr:Metal-tetracycline/H(+) antiporter [Listeria grayi]
MGGSLSILMLSRILGGVSAAFIMPGVNGMIGDLSTKATRAKNFSYMSAVINTGFIVGPGIGGFLAEISHRAPFIFAGALGILAFLSSVFMLEETNQPEELTEKTHLKKLFLTNFLLFQ